MKCPHCSIEFHTIWSTVGGLEEVPQSLRLEETTCPACDHATLKGVWVTRDGGESGSLLLYPRGTLRPIAAEVPEEYAALFREAVLTLADSPRASAALSRRCLQQLLVDVAGAPKGDLYDQIEWALTNAGLPSHLQDSLHAVRAIGNIGAHTQKSVTSGDVVDVEPGEAEWNLDTLEGLFDFSFVQPAKTAARKAALNAKQQAIGKPPLP